MPCLRQKLAPATLKAGCVRVEQLADRPEGFSLPGARPFESLVPLPDVIAASTGLSASGLKVAARYQALLEKLGPEFYILRQAPLEAVRPALVWKKASAACGAGRCPARRASMDNTEPSNFFPPMKSNLLTDRSVFSAPTRRIPKLLHAGPEKQTHPKSHPAQSLPRRYKPLTAS